MANITMARGEKQKLTCAMRRHPQLQHRRPQRRPCLLEPTKLLLQAMWRNLVLGHANAEDQALDWIHVENYAVQQVLTLIQTQMASITMARVEKQKLTCAMRRHSQLQHRRPQLQHRRPQRRPCLLDPTKLLLQAMWRNLVLGH